MFLLFVLLFSRRITSHSCETLRKEQSDPQRFLLQEAFFNRITIAKERLFIFFNFRTLYSLLNMSCLLWLLAAFVLQVAGQQCTPGAHSIRGSYLKGHVMSSATTANIGECLVKCASDPRCKSINFRFKGLFCELNDADRSTHPWDYGPCSQWHAYSDYPYQTPDPQVSDLLCLVRLCHGV